jgi:hypothetical protein
VERESRFKPPAAARLETATVAFSVVLLSALALAWFSRHGYTLYFGDAEAHLNIARRIIDSRTPGFDQVGTAWLPLPHLLTAAFVWNDSLWRSGLAGSIPSGLAFIVACVLLYATIRRMFGQAAPAIAAAAVFALNPNVLYLQSIPMNECVFFAALIGMLYSTAVFAQTGRTGPVLLAALFSNAASLSRYEGWFLIPFVTLFLAVSAGWRRWWIPIGFGALASVGPLFWLAFNWWHYSNAIEFYNGPYSAKAIYERGLRPGQPRFSGDHHWLISAKYLFVAARLCAGWPLTVIGMIGAAAAVLKRKFWPVTFLLLPGVFYVMSMYSAGAVIHVPTLWPHTWYNIRYGSTLIPLFAVGTAALISLAPPRARPAAAWTLAIASLVPWFLHTGPSWWLLWKESEVNSEARRQWTAASAGFLAKNYRMGDGIYTSFGDLTGILRSAGIPLRESLHEGNNPAWLAAGKRPDLFLFERWAVGFAGDAVSETIRRANRGGQVYRLADRIVVNGAQPVEIYERVSDSRALAQGLARGGGGVE